MAIYNLGGGGGQPELQSKTATPLITNAQQIIVPDNGYDGLSQVTVNPMPAGALKAPTVNSIGYVSSGVQTAGYLDTSAATGLQLKTKSGGTYYPIPSDRTISSNGSYFTGDININGVKTYRTTIATTASNNITISVPTKLGYLYAVSFFYSASDGTLIYPSNATQIGHGAMISDAALATGNHSRVEFLLGYGSTSSNKSLQMYRTQQSVTVGASSVNITISGVSFASGYYFVTIVYG